MNPETEEYIEYRINDEQIARTEVRCGWYFFEQSRFDINAYTHPDDREKETDCIKEYRRCIPFPKR